LRYLRFGVILQGDPERVRDPEITVATGRQSMPLAEIALAIQMAYYGANLFKLGDDYYQKFKKAPSKEEVGEMKAEAMKTAQSAVSDLPSDTTLSSSIIDVLNKRVQQTMQALEDCYDQPDAFMLEMGRQAGGLRYQYCFLISEMKNFNGGRLPSFIVGTWNDICCQDGNPKYKFPR
jgi:hypothetical protein